MIKTTRVSSLWVTWFAGGLFALGGSLDLQACVTCGCGTDCEVHDHGDGTHSHDASTHDHGDGTHSHGATTAGGMSFMPLSLGSTSPAPSTHTPTTARFGVVADTQGQQYLSQLTADMNNQNLDLALYPGDLVEVGASGSWDSWISDTNPANFDLYMVPGNHDLPVGGDALWQSKFSWLPNSQTVGGANGSQTGFDQMDYYFDVGNTRFISITTDSQANGSYHPAAALDWFENVLNDATTQSKDHVFVMTHHTVTYSSHDGSGGTSGRFWRAMVDSGAPVHGLFTGHWHHYNPGQPDPYNQDLWEVVSGTGNSSFDGEVYRQQVGYTVYNIDGAEVSAEFYGDLDGDGSFDDLIDTFMIATTTPAAPGLVAHYNFDNASTNADYANLLSPLGKQNNGLYYNGATSTGGELVLDGANDYADGFGISNYNMAILLDLTVAVEANFDSLDGASNGNTLISYSDDSDYANTNDNEVINQPYNLRIRSDKKLAFYWERNDAVRKEFVSSVAAPVNAGEWHEYRVTRDATTGEVRFYVDGIQLGSTQNFNENTELPTGGQGGRIRMGANLKGAWPALESDFFDGKIDNVSIWNMVTLDQVTFLLGDLDMDTDVDADDWEDYLGGLAIDLSAMSVADRYANGDLNGDGINNFDDFLAFTDAFELANGPESFEAMLASVPEPAGLLMLGLGGVLMLLRRKEVNLSRLSR